MTNFKKPQTEATEFAILMRMLCILGGIYIWEFFTTFSFELDVYSGKRPFRWAMILYFGSRWLGLGAVICLITSFNLTEYNCIAMSRAMLFCAYYSLGCATGLLALRAIAIWKWNLIVRTTIILLWLVDVTWFAIGIAKVQAKRDPIAAECELAGTIHQRVTNMLTSGVDTALLLIMTTGILRERSHHGALWRVLYRHGIIWMTLAILAEVPPMVFLALNLNDTMNFFFQIPHMTIMTIGAARMHRDLLDYRPQLLPSKADHLPDFQLTPSRTGDNHAAASLVCMSFAPGPPPPTHVENSKPGPNDEISGAGSNGVCTVDFPIAPPVRRGYSEESSRLEEP